MNIKGLAIGTAIAAFVIGGGITGAAAHASIVETQTVQQHALDAKLTQQKVSETQTHQADYQAAAAAAADTQAAIDAKAAADALATQQAAAAAAAQAAAAVAPVPVKPRAATVAPAGPIRCPAGSQANSNDGTNDTSCFPVKCFTMVVDPSDPASAECLTAFKP